MTALRAIVFDFDGVIADSEAPANRVLAECLSEIGLATSYDDALDLYCGHRWADCIERIEARLGRPLPERFVEDCQARTWERVQREIVAVPGIAEFLDRCAHLPRAVASSSATDWLEGVLARLGLGHHLEERLFSAAGLARGKPHPDIYLRAAEGLGIAPAECAAIEDSPIGVAAAVAANMRVIGLCAASHIRPGHDERLLAAGAHHVAHSYREVEGLLFGDAR
ncbi:MAG TPA: HAD family phosphatase [Myxococcota bacterium]|nr:HAD family phosphatase [Myxococcota bacterium]